MKLLGTISFLIGFTFICFSQTGNLTVFSDDGSAFYLMLNGQKYNETAQTNIRVEELPNPYYSCKIIFSEPNKPSISKNIQLADANGILQDVTYIIKAQSPLKYVLRYYSAIPAAQNMERPAAASVYRFGEPNEIIAGPDYSTENATPTPAAQTTQKITTTTTQTGASMNMGQAGININMDGLGLNMNLNLPVDGATTTTTTTTTTITTDGYAENTEYNTRTNHQSHQEYEDKGGCRYAMDAEDFNAAKATISSISFSDTQLSTAKSIASSNCLNSDQIGSIMGLFSFEETKLDFAKFAYDFCTDRNNYFKVVNKFTFDASKNELNEYISTRR